MSRRLATRREAVRALGLASPRALDKLIERGAPGPRPGKRGGRRYDVAALSAWRQQRQAQAQPALDLATERAKLARVQRQLTMLKLRQARGELIPVKDATAAGQTIAAAVRAQLRAVPPRAVLAGLPKEHAPTIKTLIDAALRELSELRTLGAAAPHAADGEGAA